MSRMLSTWPVLITATVDDAARQGGTLTDAAIQELCGVARDEYFSHCATIQQAQCEFGALAIQRGTAVVGQDVSVSAAVIEIFPEGFTMSGRVRGDQDEIVADTRCFVTPADGVTDAIRDELIALAHNAPHWH
jgi:hypothetical protein